MGRERTYVFERHKKKKRLGMDLQENPSNGSRGTADKVICSAGKLTFIIQRMQRNLHPT
jgi:hypothetical protein